MQFCCINVTRRLWEAEIIVTKIEYDRQERGLEFLLKKYETKQPGESNGANPDKMKVWRIKQKLRYADYVLNELNMKGIQREQVYHILKDIPDLRKLCRKCKCEPIITVICFYIKYCTTPTVPLTHYNRYKVCREHNLSLELYSKVVSNLSRHFQTTRPVSYVRYV